MIRPKRNLLQLSVGLLFAACTASAANAQDELEASPPDDMLLNMSLDNLMQMSVSTGVRFKGQTTTNSTLSLVGFSAEDLRTNHGGTNDLNMVLRDLLPSFNYLTEPVNDVSTHVRPFSLRGLPSDETLVLVNGKRFHRSALVQVTGSAQTLGSQGTDLSQIPAFGLKRIEVLRDGASAQYGSDAIAGVINLILDERDGTEIQVQHGRTAEGRSSESRASLNVGTRLSDTGFLNLTGEFVHKDEVSRGMQRPDAAYYASQGLSVANPAQIWGTPILDSQRLLWNARVDLANDAQAYMFGNFSHANSDSSFNYRPLTRDFFTHNINTSDGSLVACPAVVGDQYGYLTAQNCLSQTVNNPALFNFQSQFPGGFTPRLAVHNVDISQTLGVNGKMAAGSTFDVSFSLARNRIETQLRNTINPSLGESSPNTFALGAFVQSEQNLNADFVWPVNAQLSLATGAEWRKETYQAIAGEPTSWQVGPYPSLGIGANGMPGIDPSEAGDFQRSNVSAYLDSEYKLSKVLLLSGAARVENYSDFGTTTNGKLSFRYLLTDSLSLRGAFGTGFRAPSPAQANMTNITHNAGGATILVGGIIPATSPIAHFFGAQPLEPERSQNISLGVAYQNKALSLTVNAFQIKIRDRIELTDGIVLTDPIRAQMLASGITNSGEYDVISVFNNAADSVSQGMDITTTYELSSNVGHTEFQFDVSHVTTQITPNGNGLVLSAQTLYNLAMQTPKTKADLIVRHRIGDWKLMTNAVFYGPFSVNDGTSATSYPSKYVVNSEANFSPSSAKAWKFGFGVGNLLNTKAHSQNALSIGSPYIAENPFEYQGRSYYASAKYAF